ncbi:MAG: hypothetical protein N2443_08755 [Blastocatellia bacterium]|nr:hypothetical protein [Blastocatellia bacterium]
MRFPKDNGGKPRSSRPRGINNDLHWRGQRHSDLPLGVGGAIAGRIGRFHPNAVASGEEGDPEPKREIRCRPRYQPKHCRILSSFPTIYLLVDEHHALQAAILRDASLYLDVGSPFAREEEIARPGTVNENARGLSIRRRRRYACAGELEIVYSFKLDTTPTTFVAVLNFNAGDVSLNEAADF